MTGSRTVGRLKGTLGRATCACMLLTAPITVAVPPDNGSSASSERSTSNPSQSGEGDLREEEVRFPDGSVELSGTLYRPSTSRQSPAVVVLAGSDRSARGPLRIRLAKQFAAQGVAALVYDSPGTGSSSGNARLQTRDDRATEALAAVRFLRTQMGLNPQSIGLFGGSEGADVALLAAGRETGIAFVIAVSGAIGASVFEVMVYSAEKTGYRLQLTPEEIGKMTTFKEVVYALMTGLDLVEWSLLDERVSSWGEPQWHELIDLARNGGESRSPSEKQQMLGSLRRVTQHFAAQKWFAGVEGGQAFLRLTQLDAEQFFGFLEASPLVRDWDRDLRCEIQNVKCPILAIWGEEDAFLPPLRSAARLKKILKDSGHPDFAIHVLPDAGHFLTRTGPAGPFVPEYLDILRDWLARHLQLDD